MNPASLYLYWLLTNMKFNTLAFKGMIADRLKSTCNWTEHPDLAGRTAIVTGGSRGIGLEIVKQLLMSNLEVIVACRNTEAGEKAIKKVRESGITTGTTRVMYLDNSKLESVRNFVAEFGKHYDKLHILVNNAGVMFTPYKETAEGFEQQYGVNYLSHYYLTVLMFPYLQSAGMTSDKKARIINVSSIVQLLGKINLNDVNNKNNYNAQDAYAQSKLAQVLFTRKMDRIFKLNDAPITITAVHPGIVNTGLYENSVVSNLPMIRNLFKTAKQGATTVVYAAVSPRTENMSGSYLSDCGADLVNPMANNLNLQDALYELSWRQCDLDK